MDKITLDSAYGGSYRVWSFLSAKTYKNASEVQEAIEKQFADSPDIINAPNHEPMCAYVKQEFRSIDCKNCQLRQIDGAYNSCMGGLWDRYHTEPTMLNADAIRALILSRHSDRYRFHHVTTNTGVSDADQCHKPTSMMRNSNGETHIRVLVARRRR